MDEIDSWDPPEVLKKYAIGGFIGYDKEGSPVRVNLLPHFDFRGKTNLNFSHMSRNYLFAIESPHSCTFTFG